MKNKLQVVIADNHQSNTILCTNFLQKHNIQVTATQTLDELKTLLMIFSADILLYDLEQNIAGNMAFLQTLSLQRSMGIIVFTHKVDPIDKYIALETCADDFIQKPCNFREVVARIRAVHRRVQSSKEQKIFTVYCQDFVINRLLRTVILNTGQEVNLTQYEFDVLNTLVRNKKRPLSRQKIINLSFNDLQAVTLNPRNIDSIIYRLRQKLIGKHSIQSVYGVGYMFREADLEVLPSGVFRHDSIGGDVVNMTDSIQQLAMGVIRDL